MVDPALRIGAFVIGVVLTMLAVGLLVCVSPRQFVSTTRQLPVHLVEVAPYVGVLGAVLVINKGIRPVIDELSWSFGFNVTGSIYGFEGTFVARLQSVLPEVALHYFAFVYVFGYAFLLIFPLLAYLTLPSLRPLKQLLLAYAVNYGVGVVCYTLVIAYGPRNVFPDVVAQPLFEQYPAVMYLTSAVNTNTNVFPSLHTSLAVTVLLFAVLTHDRLPRWTPIACVLAVSVVFSTMALGIHWVVDVLAGMALAVASVAVAQVWLPSISRRRPIVPQDDVRHR